MRWRGDIYQALPSVPVAPMTRMDVLRSGVPLVATAAAAVSSATHRSGARAPAFADTLMPAPLNFAPHTAVREASWFVATAAIL